MPQDFVPYEVVPGECSKGLILLCDHARNTIPQSYGTLGLPAGELERHIAYDIGAELVMRGLAAELGVPGIMATYSRLLIDPNRGEDDPTLIRQLYDGTIIPGNYPISNAERTSRRDEFYRPYHEQVRAMIDDFLAQDIIPAVIAIHSMTDRWNGLARPWQLSVLWDSDPRLAGPLLKAFRELPGITVGENEPYDGALAGDTMHPGRAAFERHSQRSIRVDPPADSVARLEDSHLPAAYSERPGCGQPRNSGPHNHHTAGGSGVGQALRGTLPGSEGAVDRGRIVHGCVFPGQDHPILDDRVSEHLPGAPPGAGR